METRTADPAARRRLLIALAVTAMLGAGMLYGWPSVRSATLAWINSEGGDPLERATGLLRGLGLFLSVSLLAPAVYCWIVALRIDTSGEFPPPGMKLLRDAKLLRGDAARGRAWLLRAIAIKFALLAVVCGAMVWALAGTLLR